MDKSRRNAYGVMLLVLIGCGIMAWVEGALRPVYPVKSALKIAVFLGCAGLYTLLSGDREPFHVLRKAGAVRLAAPLALGVLVCLLGGYALLSPWLDLSAIPENLAAKEGITRETFPLAAAYITLCNSLLEEFFFRGFAFLTLYRAGFKRLAYGFSALAFALYHVSITDGWGSPALIVLMVAGLTAAGLLFNWLDREGSVLPSWLVHMGANLGTNGVGFILFGIL
ncbi:MAG: CPBP family intramembrane metalloprotease [Lawsonibacter sp.]|nr:CPBP family intramembrane metalloprotease [Lawsonibacter sp.]